MKAIRRDVFFGLLLLIVLGGPFLFRVFAHFLDHRELIRERELAASEGIPTSVDALRPKTPIPDEKNAAIEIRQAHDLIYRDRAKLGFSQVAVNDARIFFNQKSEDIFAGVREGSQDPAPHFAVFEKPINLMLAASNKERLDFHRPWEDGAGVLFPELASIKMLVRVICARAIYADKLNERSTAKKYLFSAARICNLIRQEPSMVAALVSASCEQIVLDALLQLQKASVNAKAWLVETTDLIAALGPPLDLKYSLQSEVLMTTAFLDNFTKKGGPEFLGLTAADLRQRPIRFDLRDRTEIEVLRAYRDLYRKLPAERYDYLGFLEASKGAYRKVGEHLVRFSKVFQYFDSWMNVRSEGPVGQAALSAASALARRRLALAFAQAMTMRANTSQFPKSLPLKGEDAVDPLTGRLLIYWSQGGKLMIYSAGIDQTDSGGNGHLAPNGSHPFDIVVQFP